jgi:hypothetical protein
VLAKLLHELLAGLSLTFENYVGEDRLSLILVVPAYDRSLGDGRV